MIRLSAFVLSVAFAAPAYAQSIDFGDDSSDYSGDSVCDDRRFVGSAMATSLDWADTGRDFTDCSTAFNRGDIRLFNFVEARAAVQCNAIDYGDDSGDFPNDGECDDPRFEGMAVDGVVLEEDTFRDATDCRRACEFGLLGLRDYETVKPSQRKGAKN